MSFCDPFIRHNMIRFIVFPPLSFPFVGQSGKKCRKELVTTETCFYPNNFIKRAKKTWFLPDGRKETNWWGYRVFCVWIMSALWHQRRLVFEGSLYWQTVTDKLSGKLSKETCELADIRAFSFAGHLYRTRSIFAKYFIRRVIRHWVLHSSLQICQLQVLFPVWQFIYFWNIDSSFFLKNMKESSFNVYCISKMHPTFWLRCKK